MSILGASRAAGAGSRAKRQRVPKSGRRVELPIAGPLPESIELTLGDQIYIAKEQSPPDLRNRLLRLAAFQNTEFYKAQAMRLSTYGKPRIIGCASARPRPGASKSCGPRRSDTGAAP